MQQAHSFEFCLSRVIHDWVKATWRTDPVQREGCNSRRAAWGSLIQCSSTEVNKVQKVIEGTINRQLKIILIILLYSIPFYSNSILCMSAPMQVIWSSLFSVTCFCLLCTTAEWAAVEYQTVVATAFAAPFPILPDKCSLIHDTCFTAYIQSH